MFASEGEQGEALRESMKADSIAAIHIDDEGRLLVVPSATAFPLIYREAMEVHWDETRQALYSPKPRDWSYGRWFQQVCNAAKEQGVALQIDDATAWVNVPAEVRDAILTHGTVDQP